MIQNWNMGLPYAFPSFSMVSRVLLETKQECVPLMVLIALVMSAQPWYPKLLNLCVKEAALLPQWKQILITPKSIVHPLMVENSLTLAAWLIPGNPFYVKEFQKILLTLLQIKGTLFNYELTWSKWDGWCLERKIDPFQAPVKDIIEYLTFLFNYDNECRTTNLSRSAISASHAYIDGLLVWKNPRNCLILTGVINVRPHKPRYMFVWGVNQVLDFVKEVPKKELALKVIILLALTTSSRISALHILDLNHLIKATEYYEFS